MSKLATFAVLLLTTLFAATHAANVEAGEVTTVIVDAPLFDTRTGADNGCGSTGCSGDLTRVSGGGGIILVWTNFLDSSVLFTGGRLNIALYVLSSCRNILVTKQKQL